MKTLHVTKRETSADTDTLRENGKIPAVYYGRSTESTPITVDVPAFIKLWQEVGGSSVFELERDGDSQPALIQDIDLHPVTDQPIHADFYVIEEGQKVTGDVPIEPAGTAPAVKNLGGLLVRVMRTVEIEADPQNLPDAIEVDVSDLEEFGDQATIGEITPPEGVTILADEDDVAILIEEPEELEELEPEEEEEELDFEDIEVEGERPDEEELEEGEETDAEGGESEPGADEQEGEAA
jgi:large subunit ribosomal protein L25